jgi:dihydroorotate dehydrogenase (fumarate)
MTSALLRHGIEHLSVVLAQMRDWLAEQDYHSLRMMRGCMSFRSVANPSAYERANYLKVLRSHALFPPG